MAKREWNDIKRRLEGLAPAQEGACPECGGVPSGAGRHGPNDTWEILFEEEFEEKYGVPLPEGPSICVVCGKYIDYGAPLEGGGGYRHTYIFGPVE
jgi:hypothetical protein